jgi:hypothetical protein
VHGWAHGHLLYQREPLEPLDTDVRGDRPPNRVMELPSLTQGFKPLKGRWSDVKTSPKALFGTFRVSGGTKVAAWPMSMAAPSSGCGTP